MPGSSRASKNRTSSSIGVARTYLPHMLSERRERSATRPSHQEAGDDQDDGDDDGELHQQGDRAGNERKDREGDDHTDGDRANDGDGVERANAFRPASGFEHGPFLSRSLQKSTDTPLSAHRSRIRECSFERCFPFRTERAAAPPYRECDHYYEVAHEGCSRSVEGCSRRWRRWAF